MMTNLQFGLVLAVVGIGGTLVTLWVLGLLAELLKKIFPLVVSKAEPPK